jgi:hypothetical protein
MITVKEAPIETAVIINQTIAEFDAAYTKEYFESRFANIVPIIESVSKNHYKDRFI